MVVMVRLSPILLDEAEKRLCSCSFLMHNLSPMRVTVGIVVCERVSEFERVFVERQFSYQER